MDKLTVVVKTVEGLAWFFRKLHLEGVVWQVRDLATASVLSGVHLKLVPRMTQLAIQMANNWNGQDEVAALIAQEICSESRKVMGKMLELPHNQLHCCLKMIAPKKEPGEEDRVATWVRSQPFDARPAEIGEQYAHSVDKNTVWCSLYGRSDGMTHWNQFPCFACNDLLKRGAHFQCDRANWANFYRSALVFPIGYAKNAQGTEMANLGFMAYDSPKIGAFRGLADIFDFRDDPTGYLDRLHQSAAFHLGAVIADTLGACLGTAYEGHAKGGS